MLGWRRHFPRLKADVMEELTFEFAGFSRSPRGDSRRNPPAAILVEGERIQAVFPRIKCPMVTKFMTSASVQFFPGSSIRTYTSMILVALTGRDSKPRLELLRRRLHDARRYAPELSSRDHDRCA